MATNRFVTRMTGLRLRSAASHPCKVVARSRDSRLRSVRSITALNGFRQKATYRRQTEGSEFELRLHTATRVEPADQPAAGQAARGAPDVNGWLTELWCKLGRACPAIEQAQQHA
jgi:hypothetical protein